MQWNSFLYDHETAVANGLSRRICETKKHARKTIPATTFQVLWERNDENLTLSQVLSAWFACSECAAEMLASWTQLNIELGGVRT